MPLNHSVEIFSFFAVITGDGELITATLYPYWNDEPNADMSVAKARTIVNLCWGKPCETHYHKKAKQTLM